MTAAPPTADPMPEPQPEVVDWLPDTAAAVAWNVAGLVITVAGLALFALPVLIRSGSGPGSGSIEFGLVDVLLVAILSVVVLPVHEALHGLVMLGFGVRPTFGVMMVGHVMPALYTTAIGHEFTRAQYLVVAAGPMVVISVVGFLATFAPWGGLLVVPLALHLGGCVGDLAAVRRTLREAPTTTCEDMRDGVRFRRRGVSPAR